MVKKRPLVALVRAEAEIVKGTHVRFTWPCGTQRTKDLGKGPVHKRLSELGVRISVKMWSHSGTTVPCPKHGRYATDCKKRKGK